MIFFFDNFKADSSISGKPEMDPRIEAEQQMPATITVVDFIEFVKSRKFLKVLLGSGSTSTLIKKIHYQEECKENL